MIYPLYLLELHINSYTFLSIMVSFNNSFLLEVSVDKVRQSIKRWNFNLSSLVSFICDVHGNLNVNNLTYHFLGSTPFEIHTLFLRYIPYCCEWLPQLFLDTYRIFLRLQPIKHIAVCDLFFKATYIFLLQLYY